MKKYPLKCLSFGTTNERLVNIFSWFDFRASKNGTTSLRKNVEEILIFLQPLHTKDAEFTMRAFIGSGLERKSRLTTLVCLLCTSWLPNHAALQQWGLLSAHNYEMCNVLSSNNNKMAVNLKAVSHFLILHKWQDKLDICTPSIV